ncbi:hypothetical protein AAY473_030040 [Plecturocebus cupreus]
MYPMLKAQPSLDAQVDIDGAEFKQQEMCPEPRLGMNLVESFGKKNKSATLGTAASLLLEEEINNKSQAYLVTKAKSLQFTLTPSVFSALTPNCVHSVYKSLSISSPFGSHTVEVSADCLPGAHHILYTPVSMPGAIPSVPQTQNLHPSLPMSFHHLPLSVGDASCFMVLCPILLPLAASRGSKCFLCCDIWSLMKNWSPAHLYHNCPFAVFHEVVLLGRVQWLTPIIPALWEAEVGDHLRSGVQDQPG